MKRVKNTETALKSNANNWNSHFFLPTCVSWHYIKRTSPVQVSPTLVSLITLYFFSSKILFVNPWSLCLIFTLLFALTWDHNVLPTDPFRREESTGPRKDFKHAQAVRRVSDLIQRGQRPPATGRKRELGETQLLLHEWDKLSLDEDGILRRRKGTRTQVIVPRQTFMHCQGTPRKHGST